MFRDAKKKPKPYQLD